MRGLGKTQEKIQENMFWKVFECISDINFDHIRYATINDIHRYTGINVESIRKHIVRGKKNVINECKGFNNARYFYTSDAKIAIEDHPNMKFELLNNTENHINSLKFPPKMYRAPLGTKIKLRKKPVKSGRDIQRKKSSKSRIK